jgi:DNA polymerase-3 subunit beta
LIDTIRSLPSHGCAFTIDVALSKIKITTPNGVFPYRRVRRNIRLFRVKSISEMVLDSGVLRKLVYRTAFAVSMDELRPAMMGILLQTNGKEIRAVSTDGHRLSRFIYKPEKGAQLGRDIIVPAKVLGILVKGLETGACTVSTSDTHVRFKYEQTVLVSRLIEESYPNYESVIPHENARLLTINEKN